MECTDKDRLIKELAAACLGITVAELETLLAFKEPSTIMDVARRLGQARSTIATHIYKLRPLGLIKYVDNTRTGTGRKAKLYVADKKNILERLAKCRMLLAEAEHMFI
jgi:predicted transcriptional regulator